MIKSSYLFKGQRKFILVVKSQTKYLAGQHFDRGRRSEYRIYRNVTYPLVYNYLYYCNKIFITTAAFNGLSLAKIYLGVICAHMVDFRGPSHISCLSLYRNTKITLTNHTNKLLLLEKLLLEVFPGLHVRECYSCGKS